MKPCSWRNLGIMWQPPQEFSRLSAYLRRMAEIRTVTTLRSKRDEILSTIRAYERQLEQARADLAHINAVIRVFEATGDPKDMLRYVETHRLFKYREKWELCREALAKDGDLSTRDLALHLLKAKGFDTSDAVLLTAATYQLVHSLRQQAKRGHVQVVGKRHGMCVWRLPAPT
jgi:hypothetical protein